MSLLFRDNQGHETPVAGLNGLSGELVYGASTTRSGTFSTGNIAANSSITKDITFSSPMPDADYVITVDYGGEGSGVGTNRLYLFTTFYNKTVNGFRLRVQNTSSAVADIENLNWYAFKLYTVEGLADLETASAEHESKITTLQTSMTSAENDISLKQNKTLSTPVVIQKASKTTVESALSSIVATMNDMEGSLGDDYVINTSNFTNVPKSYKVGTFATANSPNVQVSGDTKDSGDWNILNLYSGSPDYATLLAASPRCRSLYLGRCWGGSFDSWYRVACYERKVITNKTVTLPTGGYVSISDLTGVSVGGSVIKPVFHMTAVSGAVSDCWVEIKSSKYGWHAVFTNIPDGTPVSGTITVSGVLMYSLN